MKYIVTIFNRETQSNRTLHCSPENIDETIELELGGWGNLFMASTGGVKSHSNEYMQTGTTRDDKDIFSILCIDTTK